MRCDAESQTLAKLAAFKSKFRAVLEVAEEEGGQAPLAGAPSTTAVAAGAQAAQAKPSGARGSGSGDAEAAYAGQVLPRMSMDVGGDGGGGSDSDDGAEAGVGSWMRGSLRFVKHIDVRTRPASGTRPPAALLTCGVACTTDCQDALRQGGDEAGGSKRSHESQRAGVSLHAVGSLSHTT